MRLLKRQGTQEVYVAKVFNTLHPEQSDLLSAELQALMVIDCPCVVGFHGVSGVLFVELYFEVSNFQGKTHLLQC